LNIEDIMLSSIKLSRDEKKAAVPTCWQIFAAAVAAGSTEGVVVAGAAAVGAVVVGAAVVVLDEEVSGAGAVWRGGGGP
jgi:hypothetical protein